MYVATAHAYPGEVFVQLLRHSLGQGSYQHPLVGLGAFAYFLNEVIHLILHRTHLYRRVQQARRAHHLFHHQALALL